MSTTRKLERGILRYRFGARQLGPIYKERHYKPKKRCAFLRGIINLYKLLTNKF